MTVIIMAALAIIVLRIRQSLQELTQDDPGKCDGCGHCSNGCLGRRDPKVYCHEITDEQ